MVDTNARELDMTAGDIPRNVPVPEAVYKVRIHKITPDTVTDSKTKEPIPVWNAQLVIQDEGEYFGRYLFDTFFLPPAQGAWKLRALAEAIDYPSDERLNADRMIDGECYAVVEIEPERTDERTQKHYDARNRVKTYKSLLEAA